MRSTRNPDKAAMSENLARLTEDFLKAGGKINHCTHEDNAYQNGANVPDKVVNKRKKGPDRYTTNLQKAIH